MINLKIDPEFQSQIPPLTDDEFKQLEENILKEGKLISPLIVWGNPLVDGHNRYAILQKHPEIYFSTMPLRFENREEAIAWICRNQLGRRNLSPEQKRYLLGKQYEAEKKAAKIFRGNQYTLVLLEQPISLASSGWLILRSFIKSARRTLDGAGRYSCAMWSALLFELFPHYNTLCRFVQYTVTSPPLLLQPCNQ